MGCIGYLKRARQFAKTVRNVGFFGVLCAFVMVGWIMIVKGDRKQ